MKWKAVNRFVDLARNNGKLLLGVRVLQQHSYVLLENETRRGDQRFILERVVHFHEIASFRNLPALADSVCGMMRKDIEWEMSHYKGDLT